MLISAYNKINLKGSLFPSPAGVIICLANDQVEKAPSLKLLNRQLPGAPWELIFIPTNLQIFYKFTNFIYQFYL
ncbi:MAG: hypothetical protein A3B89_03730 [Candidatus Buchananbacteria bacterium RIFCSPHIGHO2_02_FULL_40_13]|uniref:Uncharacterized protein n=1 Tax=Candidatus Buchananbacteria bacterium RIFCSPLOWO2_01_FULL_39_33 TaxID=1797543 RepID=A0A1G1YHU9_9BACT|nr:MAG: hypothetical protein A2820_01230 [Candidatus Buchananbacteria bacterium RIFCSPHIGHO2_01_FULL_40_35]OGY48984.1 MAG: hypothetical protein A3B89_03730 [Candidatus Buchananbacteria bacterium RIFCSPHIGHO2_02_FULL_40_13]OGY51834.1 MAG: hypothetical protein A3A02_03595 [Candidatus Buchananbacteria bacterium RIFCSPLOWO2_01_FULL_39_33]